MSSSGAAAAPILLEQRSHSSALDGVDGGCRSVHRYPTDLSDQFGSQKRRLVESFEGLTLLDTGGGGMMQ